MSESKTLHKDAARTEAGAMATRVIEQINAMPGHYAAIGDAVAVTIAMDLLALDSPSFRSDVAQRVAILLCDDGEVST